MARGGKRPGSGRKSNPAKALRLGEACALRVLSQIKHERELKTVYTTCQDSRLKAYIIFRLMEFAYGKPTQTEEHTGPQGGPIQLEHTIKFGNGSDPHKP